MGIGLHRNAGLTRRVTRWLGVGISCLWIGCGDDGAVPGDVADTDTETGPGDGLAILPLVAVNATIGQVLTVRVDVNNPRGVALQWDVVMPTLPAVASTWAIAGTPAGAVFQYTPLPGHEGEHSATVTVSDGNQTAQQSLRISVSSAASAPPRFSDDSQGVLVDLSKTSCVDAKIRVLDDDSPSVAIRTAGEVPAGFTLERAGPLEALARWCPSPAQLDQALRWTIRLVADDGTTQTAQGWQVVFRLPGRTDCAGAAPVVEIVSPQKGETLDADDGYRVVVRATDAEGLREAPTLFWSLGPIADEDAPDLGTFQLAPCVNVGTDTFQCRIPDVGLAAEQTAIVYAVASATDNDDATGTACDQTTDSELLRFVGTADAGAVPGDVADCGGCTRSRDCAAGVCVDASAGQGICVPRCESGCGACRTATTAEARTVSVCSATCGVPATCAADAYEPNESRDDAAVLLASTAVGRVCGDDTDAFAFEVSVPDEHVRVTLTLAPETGDLDLELVSLDGQPIGTSAGVGRTETVAFCPSRDVTDDGLAVLLVRGFDGATGDYALSIERGTAVCCQDDTFEENDRPERATPLDDGTLVEGIVCPSDPDFFAITLSAAARVSVLLVFDTDEVDFDLDLYDASGRLVARSATLGDEVLDLPLAAGVWRLRVYGFATDEGPYLLEWEQQPLTICATDSACAPQGVCVPVIGDPSARRACASATP